MIALPKLDLLTAITSLLYPPVCAICRANIRGGQHLCDQCETKAVRIVAPFCQTCSEPFEGAISGAFTCANCAHRTIYFDTAVVAYRSRGIVRQIIHDFKYRRQIYLRHLVARWLYAAFDDERLRNRRFDIIIPVPLHPTRQRERGFNQASLLAELLSAEISIQSKPALERIRYTTTQTALDRAERMENLQKCPGCSEVVPEIELAQNQRVCPRCDYHFAQSAKERIESLLDPDTFVEMDADLGSVDILSFQGLASYKDRLKKYQESTNLLD